MPVANLPSHPGAEEPVFVTERSRAVAVLQSASARERMAYEREVPGLLARGETEIRAATGIDPDRLIAEAKALLEGP